MTPILHKEAIKFMFIGFGKRYMHVRLTHFDFTNTRSIDRILYYIILYYMILYWSNVIKFTNICTIFKLMYRTELIMW